MQLIPAIDLRHGQVVRLIQGDDARRTTYGSDPLRVLDGYGAAGITLVHVVDLDAAFGEEPQRPLIARLAARAGAGGPAIELGGGLRDRDDVAWALDAGCLRVILGSLAVRDPAAFARLVGEFPDRLVPALEVAGETLRVAGWREDVPRSLADAIGALRGLACPAVLVTDIERDGTLVGPNLALARDVARRSGIPALLSGGVHALDDLAAAAGVAELAGVIVGKALYDGVFTLDQALATIAATTAAAAQAEAGA